MQVIDVTRHSRITQQLVSSTTLLSFVCCSQFAWKKLLLMTFGTTLVSGLILHIAPNIFVQRSMKNNTQHKKWMFSTGWWNNQQGNTFRREKFLGHLISQFGNIPWPACSADLTPQTFFCGGILVLIWMLLILNAPKKLKENATVTHLMSYRQTGTSHFQKRIHTKLQSSCQLYLKMLRFICCPVSHSHLQQTIAYSHPTVLYSCFLNLYEWLIT